MGINCNCETPKTDISLLEQEIIKYESTEGNLIPVLQKAQDIYGYLPVDVLWHISKRLNIKPSKVMGVVSFYTQFRTKPIGKYLILLCRGTACHVNGSADIELIIKDYLKVEESEITENGLFTYNNVACLGCCSLAPAMMIGDKTYGNLSKEKIIGIFKEIEKTEAAKK